MLTFHAFGDEKKPTIVLLHPSVVFWDYFTKVIPFLKDQFHVIVPSLPGYDTAKPHQDFTSVEAIASVLAEQLLQKGIEHIALLYGCSMGGSVVIRMLADHAIFIQNAVIDGGITPYSLPWLITRGIAVRDWLMVSMGKYGGVRLLEKAFAGDTYSKVDIAYVAGVLRFVTARTIWRTFESCNNYSMPADVQRPIGTVQYWFGEEEQKERRWDIAYMKKHFPTAKILVMPKIGHAAMALLRPEEMAERIKTGIQQTKGRSDDQA